MPTVSQVTASYPQLFTTDIHRWRDYYVDKLGFAVNFMYGEPAFYGQVKRGNAVLNVRHVDVMPFEAAMRDGEVLLSVYIEATEIAALFAAYDKAGVDFQERLTTKPWGRQEFVVRDPDRNLLCFGGV